MLSVGVQLPSGESWEGERTAAEVAQQADAGAGRKGCSAEPVGTTASGGCC